MHSKLMNQTIGYPIVPRILLLVILIGLLGRHSIAQETLNSTADISVIDDFGIHNELSVHFNLPVEYVSHPDDSVTVRYVDGLQITAISSATEDQGGAMWNPGAGRPGYGGWRPQGYDARIQSKSGDETYDATLNVAPAATGSPFAIPGEGTLIISLPGEVPDRRIKKPVDQFRVIQFAETLPAPGSYRAPSRGMNAPRDHWTTDRVWVNLDRHFPADRDVMKNWQADDIMDFINRWQATAASGIYYTTFASNQISPASGLNWYGRELSTAVGQAMLLLRKQDLPPEDRRALANALVQYGIDIYGTILDGSYFQMNGGWTHGRIWIVELTGILLEDEYMVNMVTDPLELPSAPGVILTVIPFTEPRQFAPVLPAGEYYTRGTRPEVSDQMAQWGSVIGADPDEAMAYASEDVGIRYWTVQNDRSYGPRSQLGSWIGRAYHYVNIQGQAWVRAAYALQEQDGLDGALAGTKPIRDGIDTSLHQHWQMDQNSERIRAQGMIKRPDGFIRGGAGGLYGDWSQTPGRGLIDINRLHKTKPGRAYPTLLTDNGDGTITVEFNGYQPGHGHPVEHHDIRWSADGGQTWAVIQQAPDGLRIDPEITEETLILVQDRLTTAAGTGAWSPTMRIGKGDQTRVYGEILLKAIPPPETEQGQTTKL